MSRIVINPSDLAYTAALLDDSAGEYQALGTRVAYCDCGCMPPDVAAVVDAVTADVRSALDRISGVLAWEASDLARRAGVEQDGGFSAAGAAWGSGAGASTMTVGGFGFDRSMTTNGTVGTMLIGGYGSDPSMISPGVVGTMTVGGYGFDPSTVSYGVVGTMSTGGFGYDPSMSAGGGGMSTGGFGYDPSMSGGGGGGMSTGGLDQQSVAVMEDTSRAYYESWAALRDQPGLAALLFGGATNMNDIWSRVNTPYSYYRYVNGELVRITEWQT